MDEIKSLNLVIKNSYLNLDNSVNVFYSLNNLNKKIIKNIIEYKKNNSQYKYDSYLNSLKSNIPKCQTAFYKKLKEQAHNYLTKYDLSETEILKWHDKISQNKLYIILSIDLSLHKNVSNLKYYPEIQGLEYSDIQIIQHTFRDYFIQQILHKLHSYINDEIQFKKNTFKELFIREMADEDLNKLKTVFNKNKSLKDYAIMFCLLDRHKLIQATQSNKKVFFKAWFDFIKRDYPKQFTGMYKYIVDHSGDGLIYKNTNDPDYFRFEEWIETEFIPNL